MNSAGFATSTTPVTCSPVSRKTVTKRCSATVRGRLVQIIKASSMLRMPSAVRSRNCLLPVCRMNVVLDKRRIGKISCSVRRLRGPALLVVARDFNPRQAAGNYARAARSWSMRCFASATASSFSGAMVERVDRDTMGKSARLAYMPVHQLDHCHMGTMSYPRYW